MLDATPSSIAERYILPLIGKVFGWNRGQLGDLGRLTLHRGKTVYPY